MPRCRYPFGYFPFDVPVVTSPPSIIGTPDRPIGVPLETVMRWYWRVRQWSVQVGAAGVIDWDVLPYGGTYDGYPGHYHYEEIGLTASGVVLRPPVYVDQGLTTRYDNEANLVVPLPFNSVLEPEFDSGGLYSYSQPPLNDPPDVETHFRGSFYPPHLFYAVSGNGPIPPILYCSTNGLYYPRVVPNGFVGSDRTCIADLAFSIPPGEQDRKMDVMVDIDGFSYTLKDRGGYLPQAYRGGFHIQNLVCSGLSLSFSMRPSLYWEYRGRWPMDNDPASMGPYYEDVPLYNAGTGDPATNPATGVPFTAQELASAPMV